MSKAKINPKALIDALEDYIAEIQCGAMDRDPLTPCVKRKDHRGKHTDRNNHRWVTHKTESS